MRFKQGLRSSIFVWVCLIFSLWAYGKTVRSRPRFAVSYYLSSSVEANLNQAITLSINYQNKSSINPEIRNVLLNHAPITLDGGGHFDVSPVVCYGDNSGTLSLLDFEGTLLFFQYKTETLGTWARIRAANRNGEEGIPYSTVIYTNLVETSEVRAGVRLASGDTIYSQTTTVTVIPAPDAGKNQNYICNETTLQGNDLAPGNGKWTISPLSSSQTAVFDDDTKMNAHVTGLVPGETYVFRWSGCGKWYDDVVITTNIVDGIDAGIDEIVCYKANAISNSYTLKGSELVASERGTWSIVSQPENGNSVLENLHNPNAVLINLVEGVYKLGWFVTNGCTSGYDEVTLTVLPVKAGFIADPGDVIKIPDYTFNFLNTSSDNAVQFSWDFGDGATSTDKDPSHTYAKLGTYQVTLSSVSSNGCADVITKSVTIENVPGYLYVPNAFEPNNFSSELSLFKPKGSGMATYSIKIFNKWNLLVWQSDRLNDNGSPAEGWNGTIGNKPAPTGIYLWMITATLLDGTPWEGMKYENQKPAKTGQIYLIR